MKSETGYDAYFAGQLDLAPIVLRKYIINMIAIEGKSMDTVVSYFGDIFWLFRYLVALKGIEITYKGDILLPHTHGNNDYNEIIKAVSDVIDTDFIRSISRDDIKQFVMYMARRKVKASTRNRRLSAIRKQFKQMHRRRRIRSLHRHRCRPTNLSASIRLCSRHMHRQMKLL